MKKQPEPKNCKHILFRIGLQFFRNIPKKQNLFAHSLRSIQCVNISKHYI